MHSISAHTKKTKRQEKTAKTVIWIFAGITILVLFLIIGYILYRGFYYDKHPFYHVTGAVENQVSFTENPERQFVIITNKGIRLKDLTWDQLHTIYTKPRRENWGFYTQQDIKVHQFAFKPDAGNTFADLFRSYILGSGEKLTKYTNYVSSPQEMIRKVSRTPGGIGIIPADFLKKNPPGLRDVRRIGFRRISVVVHPDVLEIKNNKKLQNLSGEQLNEMLLGRISNWKEVGGINLPLRLVLPPPNVKPYDEMIPLTVNAPYQVPGNAVTASSMEDFFSKITHTKGSVGLLFYKQAEEHELPVVDVSRRERGLNLTLRFIFTPPARSGQWGGISSIIINTLLLIVLTLLFSAPIGIAAAVYLIEYAKQGRLVNILRLGTETLAGVPSIVFGLFGHIFFVRILGLGIGFISATLTVTLMILPTIVRTAEEALKTVPLSYREGSLALGATKLQTIRKVVLPAASPGILTGIILSIGRVVGETAVLLYTLGSSYSLVRSLTSSARVLSLHLYLLFSEAISFERAFATGAVLVFMIILVNFTTTRLIGRMNRMAGK